MGGKKDKDDKDKGQGRIGEWQSVIIFVFEHYFLYTLETFLKYTLLKPRS